MFFSKIKIFSILINTIFFLLSEIKMIFSYTMKKTSKIFRVTIVVLICTLGLFISTSGCVANSSGINKPSAKILPWGDQGDGTYTNPIIKADFSDPDIIRVGDDFYLVASEFHFVGMQVMHSKDLVNWQYIGQVFDKLTMASQYDKMTAYAEGTWAPAIRYHDGEFYIFVCTPSEGLFMWHAKDPAGPWSETITVKSVPRWEDPCPFWDDDGQAYLAHSHKGAGPIIIHKMSTDGTKLLDDGKEVYRGPVAEGPKMFKRNGYYYISMPENGVSNGCQTILRSKDIYGPYDRKVVLPNGSPHQGGLVELPNGEAWFIGFKQAPGEQAALGRICYLEPVKWGDDDWPIFGDEGKPVDSWTKPNVGKTYPIERPATSDEFDSETLGLQWQWNHNPINENWTLTEHPGFLRLKALPANNLSTARNTLTQKLWDDTGTIEIKLDVTGMEDGQRAGLGFMAGNRFGWVGVYHNNGSIKLDWQNQNGEAPELSGKTVWLRGTYTNLNCKFSYSLDGQTFVETSSTFRMGFQSWKGSRPVIYSVGPNGGYVDVDYFHYEYGIDTN